MGLPVTVYRSTDVGAPQISTRSAIEIINILRKCLVDGYGDKSPAGWSIPYEDANAGAAVFRNSITDASGSFVKIWTNSGSGSATNCTLLMHSAPFIDSLNPDWTNVLGKSFRDVFYRYDNYGLTWSLFATSACFYFIVYRNSSGTVGNNYSQVPIVFVGDYHANNPTDVSRFIIAGTSLSADVALTYSSIPTALQALTCGQKINRIYEVDQHTGELTYGLIGCSVIPNGWSTNKVTDVVLDTTTMTMIPLYVGLSSDRVGDSTSVSYVDANGLNTARSNAQPIFRGRMVGLYMSTFLGGAEEANPCVHEFDGHTWELLPQYHAGGSRVWLRTSGEWYAD